MDYIRKETPPERGDEHSSRRERERERERESKGSFGKNIALAY